MSRENLSLLPLLLLTFGVLAEAAAPAAESPAESLMVATPRARKLAVSATNRPFLAAMNAQQPVDLAARGYIESEHLVSGYASIYQWAPDGSPVAVTVRNAAVPYATRVLVRRPMDALKFSGRVIVELLNPGQQFDFAPLWGLSFEHFLRRGDVWVGVTVKPVAAEALKKFDPVRYAGINFAFQQPPDCAPGNASNLEDGLAWDLIAQVGALLRSSSKENPLLDLNPQRLIAAGFGETGGYVTTFANALHRALRLGGGASIYSGYFNASGLTAAAPINQCATPLADTDPRRQVLPRDAPFVVVTTESDFNVVPVLRREDSDAPQDLFRLYEIAGAAQNGTFAAGQPAAADLAIAGLAAPPQNACREPRSDFPSALAFNAIWQQYDDWLVQQQPMAQALRIATDAGHAVMVDANGNALGGWRLPQLDAAVARYAAHSTAAEDSDRARAVCAATGAVQRFDAAKLKALYRDRNEYLRRFNAAVDQALATRMIVAEDAALLKAPAVRTLPAF